MSVEAPVTVYLYQTDVPSDMESLGRIKVMDTGFSVICDSTTVINRIKDEARKIGGNAICITDHVKPSFWGSSCHQMTAIILREKEHDSEENLVANENVVIKSPLPQFKIGVNIGYGWRGAKLTSNIQGDMRDFYKKMMSNVIYDASFHYYFNETYGVGLVYSPYYTSNDAYVQMTSPVYETGKLNYKNTITFIGPVFAMRGTTNDQKWFFNLNIGIGYLGYYTNETFNNNYLKGNGATVGFLWNVGGEYKFNKNWGIGVDFSMINGILNEIEINENGYKSTFVFEDGSEEGLGQFRLTTGLRYYF